MAADRCACGHEHDGACINCLCPEWHGEVRMVPTLMNGRWNLLLPSHRAYRPEWTTGWEVPRIAAMADVIGPGDVVYDVGGEELDMGGLWASWGAQVLAIEPNPPVWPNGKAIFQSNNLDDQLLGWYVGFAGDELRDRPAWEAEHGGDGHWPICADGPIISTHGFAVISERPEIPVTTIDALADRFGPPTICTIDVEGAEAAVLRGAYRTLIENRPRCYVSEHLDMPWLDQKFPGDTHERISEYMGGLGYVGEHLATDHEAHWCYAHPDGR